MKSPEINFFISHTGKLLIFMAFIALMTGCSPQRKGNQHDISPEEIFTNTEKDGDIIEVHFQKGPSHNHPLMAIWLEDTAGKYIETIYVAQSIGTGIFGHGTVKAGHWEPGPVSRPAALPYWWHKYGLLPDPESPVPDAISGPTPKADFILSSRLVNDVPNVFNVLFEINQSWDWNEYWTNTLFPDNEAYMSSSQPALVYRARIDKHLDREDYQMKLVGYAHYAGENGMLYEDIATLSTARDIAGAIRIKFGRLNQ